MLSALSTPTVLMFSRDSGPTVTIGLAAVK
jgi:hypothetical protein